MIAQVLTPSVVKNWMLLGAVLTALLAFYVMAFDQGLLLSFVQGTSAFNQNFLHEVLHDARHAAGFPCH